MGLSEGDALVLELPSELSAESSEEVRLLLGSVDELGLERASRTASFGMEI